MTRYHRVRPSVGARPPSKEARVLSILHEVILAILVVAAIAMGFQRFRNVRPGFVAMAVIVTTFLSLITLTSVITVVKSYTP